MGMAVVLVVDGAEPSMGPEVADRLARIGVTQVSVLRQAEALAVVLDGWAFDPARGRAEALAALGVPDAGFLASVAQISLSVDAAGVPAAGGRETS